MVIVINGRTHGAPFRGYGYVPLRNGGNVVTRMGTQQQQVIVTIYNYGYRLLLQLKKDNNNFIFR